MQNNMRLPPDDFDDEGDFEEEPAPRAPRRRARRAPSDSYTSDYSKSPSSKPSNSLLLNKSMKKFIFFSLLFGALLNTLVLFGLWHAGWSGLGRMFSVEDLANNASYLFGTVSVLFQLGGALFLSLISNEGNK